jgi:hypothetical protein
MSYADTPDSPSGSTFELHPVSFRAAQADGPDESAWPTAAPPPAQPIRVPADGQIVWVAQQAGPEPLRRVGRAVDADAGFCQVRRRQSGVLAMIVQRHDILVNGRPALPLSILSARDAVVVGPGVHAYVTERYKPYIGAPTGPLTGKPCPFCRIPFTPETQVVTCRCGAAYHYEVVSPPGPDGEQEPLRCVTRIRQCLSCQRELSLEEHLEWDPSIPS